ncbi:MAG: TIGR04540 family protein [Parabacteroides sp.]|nr:TIGR04540 family protein [Parabacteroides sp.]
MYNYGTKIITKEQKSYESQRCIMEFLLYPTTVKMLAAEIINVCDAYLSRKISHTELKSIIIHYANNYPRMLFNAQDLNPTVLNRIGKKRAALVNKMLEGYQCKLLSD